MIVKKPNTRSGALRSAATLERNMKSRPTSATVSTASPATATMSNASDSQRGPSMWAPVETMPVAITNAK